MPDDLNSQDLQTAIGLWTRMMWGDRNERSDALAIAEEAGEVCRAVLKRTQSYAGQDRLQRSPADWTAEVRKELADVVITCLSMAENEGFDLMQATRERFAAVRERARRD